VIGAAAVGERNCVTRIEPNGLVVVLDAAVVLTFEGVGDPAIVERICVVRIEPDRLVKILDGAVILVFEDVGAPPRLLNACAKSGLSRIAWLQSSMALSLSCFLFHSRQRSLKRTASPGSSYRPELIARMHAAIASSPDAFAHDSKWSAVAGVAANQTVDAKARAASVHRRIDFIRMVPGIPSLGSATLSDPTESHS
jgi:hypothetical protein